MHQSRATEFLKTQFFLFLFIDHPRSDFHYPTTVLPRLKNETSKTKKLTVRRTRRGRKWSVRGKFIDIFKRTSAFSIMLGSMCSWDDNVKSDPQRCDAIQFTSLPTSRLFFPILLLLPSSSRRLCATSTSVDAIIQCPLCAMKRDCVFSTRPPRVSSTRINDHDDEARVNYARLLARLANDDSYDDKEQPTVMDATANFHWDHSLP